MLKQAPNLKKRMLKAKFIDETIRMAAIAAGFVIVTGAFFEYVLKPLWQTIIDR